MRAVLRERIHQMRQWHRLEAIQLRIGYRLSAAQRRQPLPRHLRVKEVLIGADDGAVARRGERGIVVERLVKAPPPVER